MNTTSILPHQIQGIAIHMQIPRLSLGLGVASAFGLMFDRFIRRALEDEGLLFDLPPELRMPGNPFNGKMQTLAFQDKVMATFWVRNSMDGHPMEALLVVRRELEALGLFAHSKIAWSTVTEPGWHYWHSPALVGQAMTDEDLYKMINAVLADIEAWVTTAAQIPPALPPANPL